MHLKLAGQDHRTLNAQGLPVVFERRDRRLLESRHLGKLRLGQILSFAGNPNGHP